MGRPAIAPELRFWNRVEQEGDCWAWQGNVLATGYGMFRCPQPGNRRGQALVHRWGYEAMIGEIPDGLVVDHLCRNRACVNPYHMDLVTPGVNAHRGKGSIVAANKAKTECLNGHPFDAKNTRYYKTKYGVGRGCRACARIRARKAK